MRLFFPVLDRGFECLYLLFKVEISDSCDFSSDVDFKTCWDVKMGQFGKTHFLHTFLQNVLLKHFYFGFRLAAGNVAAHRIAVIGSILEIFNA